MNELELYLQNLHINVHEDLKDQILAFKKCTFKKGDFIIREDQIARNIYFIVKGKIRHFYNIDGKAYTRWVSLKNNFVTAFASFVHQQPSLENLECLQDCELLAISQEKFQNIKNTSPQIQQLWTTSIENEVVGYEYRVYQLITTDSEKRYLDFIEKYPHFVMEVPQKYIASMLGIDPRHLSRIRKNLAQKGK